MESQGRRSFLGTCAGMILISWCIAGVGGDIPDGVVYTDVHKTVQNGNTAVLKCEFYGVPIAVYWKKGDNPTTSPNLITWVEGEPPSGSCVHDRSCEIDDHYSLIIRNARIPDQGRYMCRVSNYRGILIHNFTDVKIYAPPTEPFPVIDECVESESSTLDSAQHCSVLTNGSIVFISCTVTNYYPDLDLFFLHGPQKITDTETNEWINDDGTKNKVIFRKASPSEAPYVCVALDVPGSNDRRAATILVKSLWPTESTITSRGLPSKTTGVAIDMSNNNRAAKIALPIAIMFFIVGIGLATFFYFRRMRRDTGSGFTTIIHTEEILPLVVKAISGRFSGDISFYELWSLAYDTHEDEKMRIRQVLIELGINDVTEGLTSANIYDLLCKWKDVNKIGDQAELLRKSLESADFESRWIQLCEQRKGTDSQVSQDTLEQIILEIENYDKLQQFLGELIPNQICDINVNDPLKVMKVMKVMREWSKGPFVENPFASLSLALERSGCSPLDRIFFGEMISFFELWSLSRYLNGYEIHYVFEKLALVIEDRLTGEELYDNLCSWKDRNKTISQGKCLRDALDKANLRKKWIDMKDLRRVNTQVSRHTLEHILWQIKEPKKIYEILQKLTLNGQGTQLDVQRGLRDIIKQALTHLKIWAKNGFDENHVVLLSLALEKTGCCPVDRTFFKVPHVLTQEIEEISVQSFVDSLTSRHIRALTPCLNISKKEVTMTKENKETIFDTESMISDWIAQEECSNYEKRWKLSKAVDSIGRQDLKEFFGEMKPTTQIGIYYGTATAHTRDDVQDGKNDNQMSDFIKEEYQRIATYLSPSQIKNLSGHVRDSGDPRSTFQSYAEHRVAKKPKKDWREKLREKPKSVGFQDLIPSELKHNVYLCELLDVAFRLLLEDVYPLAKALGIPDEKLQEYRAGYTPDHLTKGTTAALIKFSEANDNDRSKVCQALSEAEYTDIAQLLEYGHETSLADEVAVTSAASNKEDKEEVLTKITENLGMSQSSSTEGALREWRSMIHPPSYNHRKSLADAVFPALGADVAISILSGQYRENGSESSSVIQTISSGIKSLDLHLIAKILDVKNARKLGTPTVSSQNTDFFELSSTTEDESKRTDTGIGTVFRIATALKIAQILGVARLTFDQDTAILQVIETWEEGMRRNPLSVKDRRDLSDKLLRAGFKEFAFEIMTGFLPRPKGKAKGKDSDREQHSRSDGQQPSRHVRHQPTGSGGQLPTASNGQHPNGSDRQQTTGTDGQLPTAGDGQHPNGSDGQHPNGSDGQQTTGSNEQQPYESDGQQLCGSDWHQPSGSNGQQPNINEGDNLAEVEVNNPAEMTDTNLLEAICNSLVDATGNNLTEATGNNLAEATGQQPTGSDRHRPNGSDWQQPSGSDGDNLEEAEVINQVEMTDTILLEVMGNNLVDATGNNLTEATGSNLAETSRQQPNRSDGYQPTGSDVQQPNRSDGHQPSRSNGQQPSGNEGDNLGEVEVNNPAEMTDTNLLEATGNNLTEATRNNLVEATGPQPKGSNGHQPTGSDGQQPNGREGQQPNGCDVHQPSGSHGHQPSGSDGQQPNGCDVHQPSGSHGHQPSGSHGPQPNGSNRHQPSGSNGQQPSGSNVHQPTGSDGQPPNGRNGQQPRGSNRQQPNASDEQQHNGSEPRQPTRSNMQQPSKSEVATERK